MVDLIKEFFERELNEAEAESLGDLIRESPEEALRFEGLLASHYLATGLPSPQLPSSLLKLPGTPGGWGSAGGLKILLLLGAAGLGFLAWKLWPSSTTVPSSQTPAPAVLSTSPVAPVGALPHPALAAKPLPVEPQEVGPTAEGEELSVVVGAQEKTLVTVRILDQTGREVRDLYTGFVQPGHWSFQWDGELTNGVPAPAGNYQIDVQSGVSHQAKDIRIKPN
jgi:hypothetical protein